MQRLFDHEKLEAYRAGLVDQLDRVITSIPLNVAEGTGSSPERIVVGSWTSHEDQLWNVRRR